MEAISTSKENRKTTQTQQLKPRFLRIEEKKFESICRTIMIIGVIILVVALAFGGAIGYNLAKGIYTYLPYTSTESYQIAKGDTLWSIAEDISDGKYDIRRVVRELQELNDLKSSDIYAYEYLTVPVFVTEMPQELSA